MTSVSPAEARKCTVDSPSTHLPLKFHLGKLTVNTQLGGYYNVVKPEDGPDWQVRLQVQLRFPK